MIVLFARDSNTRRELLTAQSENFQLEKKIHELQMNLHHPSMSHRISDIGNGPVLSMALPSGSSAPTTPNVARRYYEMKYGDKVATNNPNSNSSSNPPPSIFPNSAPTNLNPLPVRNGSVANKGPLLPGNTASANANNTARNSTTFNLRNKLPNSLQNTLATTSQSLQSKLPASLQKLPASLTQGPTINMLANKLQNAFS